MAVVGAIATMRLVSIRYRHQHATSHEWIMRCLLRGSDVMSEGCGTAAADTAAAGVVNGWRDSYSMPTRVDFEGS
jgi:hypothetical protein